MSLSTKNDRFVHAARRVAEVAAQHAGQVDVDAAFPTAAFDALRAEKLLGIMVPTDEGGQGATAAEVGRVCEILGTACANTGMIFAMHQIQVAGLTRHGGDAAADRRRRIAKEQLLIASATTEIGVGGDVRRSTCHVEPKDDGSFRLVKNAPVVSYGAHADLYALTARRDAEATPNDQVLVYADKPEVHLEPTSEWNTLGFRGTCSPGFVVTIEAHTDAILPESFATISAHTMLPCSHMFWSSVWLGIATSATAQARQAVQAIARRNPGVTPPSALRLAELQICLANFEAGVHAAPARFDEIAPGDEALDGIGFAVEMNGLKVSSSRAVVDIVTQAMVIVGINAYRRDTDYTLERCYRDAIGSQLMINNDRILATTSSLELVNRSGS